VGGATNAAVIENNAHLKTQQAHQAQQGQQAAHK